MDNQEEFLSEPDRELPYPFTECRDDGWPLCPSCGYDELFCNDVKPGNFNGDISKYINFGLCCYNCGWTNITNLGNVIFDKESVTINRNFTTTNSIKKKRVTDHAED